MSEPPLPAATEADARRVQLAAARRLYAAFAAVDLPALLELLTDDFRGVVSQGMPAGLGGTYEGPETMLRECWGRVYGVFDTRPIPEEYLLVAGEDRMIVLGCYRGTARTSGRLHEAAFAHVLRFRGSQVTELVQITDTRRWHDALAPEGSAP